MAELMQPVEDRGFERYLDGKRRAPKSDGPGSRHSAGGHPRRAPQNGAAHTRVAGLAPATLQLGGDKGPRSATALLVVRMWSKRTTAADRTEGPWR